MATRADIASHQISLAPPILLGPKSPAEKPALANRRSSPTQYRTVFLSDIHLGTRMSRPDLILDFLDRRVAETVYLVGDIVDNWHPLGRNWTDDHHQALRRLLDLPQTGTRVVYIPGNHDSFFRQYAGTTFGGIEVETEAVHIAADGRRYLVVHGDCCDVFSRRAPIMARTGSLIETAAQAIDVAQRRVLRKVRRSEWRGIENAISRTNAAIRKHDRFEERLSDLAANRGLDGVICGHFHQAALHQKFGVAYVNCGDWTGSNTAVAERFDGRLDLLGVNSAATIGPKDYKKGEFALAY